MVLARREVPGLVNRHIRLACHAVRLARISLSLYDHTQTPPVKTTDIISASAVCCAQSSGSKHRVRTKEKRRRKENKLGGYAAILSSASHTIHPKRGCPPPRRCLRAGGPPCFLSHRCQAISVAVAKCGNESCVSGLRRASSGRHC
jgi:hypothetical protein